MPIIDGSDPLELLFKGYFHQDWTLEGETARDVLQAFRDDEPEPVVQQARDQVLELLSRDLDDHELEEELHERLGLQYYPPGDGLSHRQWLEQVAEVLKSDQPTNGRGAP
jgi:hypothetical protein